MFKYAIVFNGQIIQRFYTLNEARMTLHSPLIPISSPKLGYRIKKL